MHCGEDDSSPYTSFHNGPYSSSIASSASSSTSSVWSDAASQASDNSSITSASSDSEPPYFCANQLPLPAIAIDICEKNNITKFWPQQRLPVEIAPEERQNPRRTSVGSSTRTGRPPTLIRQADRKVNFVDSLVVHALNHSPDSSALIVEAIWPLSTVACRSEMGKGVLPLRIFIQETLRRSRTSYSTLQVALYYLILIKPFVPKTDFTMEQSDDTQSFRALQCGRRMFLSALILASKYLQDRNYSSRAWSKISGLPTLEINQNEIAFLLAVNWELHITEKVFQRWTDIVLNYTPSSQPPSPGASTLSLAEQSVEWKRIVLQLNPELDNINEITSPSHKEVCGLPLRPFTPLSAYHFSGSNEPTSSPKHYSPNIMEPSPSATYPTVRPVPALGLLPTPRLTPQSTGYNTPAVSAASYMLGKSSMSLAMAQTNFCGPQATEKWASQLTSSPQGYSCNRRSSLANSVSSMSSPESMVSDTSSRTSRSSSISSASSLTSAPVSAKLDVQARCRYAKLCSEKKNRNVVVTVAEICESYDEVGADALDEAARTLYDLHRQSVSVDSSNRVDDKPAHTSNRAGAKRSRTHSLEASLHDNVRDLLMTGGMAHVLAKPGGHASDVQIVPAASSGRKRLCCATEAARGLSQRNMHPAFRPGMWDVILN
ncbi:putative g1 s-specific cyclin protein [Botrytis fragariae]|uniref:Putative g1 s-specific cyclin protein n=1 Tax=Botrytis fragariae TaxID=1964551 RepID=A0A8H6AT36_9HELO|nr:putative g1 s-specific cyclin protein [Botrytis fragariae]KAF5872935.1 putative g1 s-specific cyclin protein [Botrytis fragariae]